MSWQPCSASDWSIKRASGGSHKVLEREGWPDYVWAFHDGVEIGPVAILTVRPRRSFGPSSL